MRASSSRSTGGAKSEPPEKGVHLQPTLRPLETKQRQGGNREGACAGELSRSMLK